MIPAGLPTDACVPTTQQALYTLLSDPTSLIFGVLGAAVLNVAKDQAGRAIAVLYEFAVPDVDAILEAINFLFKEIAVKIDHAIAALVAIVDDSQPNAEEQRRNYCKVTLKIDDPYALQDAYNRSVAELWTYQQEWDILKSDDVSAKASAREFVKPVKKLREQGLALNQKVTSSSTRLLLQKRKTSSSQTPKVTHTLFHAIPGGAVEQVALDSKPNGEPAVWV